MNTLFEKIWDKHVVDTLADGTIQLYIDRHFCHEVTSPQAFGGLRARGLKVFRPEQTLCMPDHNVPTLKQEFPIEDPISKIRSIPWQAMLRNLVSPITASETIRMELSTW